MHRMLLYATPLLLLPDFICALVPSFHLLDSLAQRFDWNNISTAKRLAYHDCYQNFQCARLSVPLDWQNTSSPYDVSLAVVRLAAAVPPTDPNHGGTIILNPGGPGGSGVLWALQVADKMQRLLDGDKHYEILSFDPRGVFHSTPNAYCFDSAMESEIWYTQKRAAGDLNHALKYNWAAEEARGQLCTASRNGMYDDGENLRQHMSTAYVARDMLEITKRIAEHKHMHGRSQSSLNEQMPLHGPFNLADVKLNYVGTSYGTFLGQTFASMYPQHVGRMILDGNIDAENWVSRHEASVDDLADVHAYFFKRCFAGRAECAFYREHDSGPDDIASRMEELLAMLDDFPAYITGHGRASPITSADVLSGFFMTAYQPTWFFEPFAKLLNDLFTGVNPDLPFWQHEVPTREAFSDELLANAYQGGEVAPAVHCGDGPDLSESSFAGFQTYLQNLTARFGWAGVQQADFKIACWTWPTALRTKWRFDGPFGGAVPIFFVNNRLDPVTPIRNARKMARKFTGSGTLEHDKAGHGALWPATRCVWERVKAYVENGTLPSPNTICPSECEPFSGRCEESTNLGALWYS